MLKSESFETADILLMRNLSFFDISEVQSTPETMMQNKIEFSKRKFILHFFVSCFKITHLFNYICSFFFYRFAREFHIFSTKSTKIVNRQCSGADVLCTEVFPYTRVQGQISAPRDQCN